MFSPRAMLWGLGLMLVGAFLARANQGLFIDFDAILACGVLGFAVGYLAGLFIQEGVDRGKS